MKKLGVFLCVLVLVFGVAGVANSALWDRGGGLIYDDVLHITWLQDANYAYTSGYWDSLNSYKEPGAPGAMMWEDCLDWADNLTYYDTIRNITWSDWRLPHVLPVNGSSYDFFYSFDGSTDEGFNISAPGSVYPGSTGSEMAYMYYNNLNNLGMFRDEYSTNENWGLNNTGPFVNLQAFAYWSGTKYPSGGGNPETGIPFFFYDGEQRFHGYSISFAWAVMDGDVGAIPSEICKASKLKAASNLCKSYASCNVREMNNPVFDLAACISMAKSWFEWRWDNAEDNAAKKDLGCSTASDTAIEDIILLALDDIHDQIVARVDLVDNNSINLMKALQRFAQHYYSNLLVAEANNIIMENDDKLVEATSKAEEIFFNRCDLAIEWARKREVVISEPYVMADEVAGIVEGLVVDILSGMNL